jgi:endonuclease/exonuclease/phosphatase (EEP) superfamily protein YafD
MSRFKFTGFLRWSLRVITILYTCALVVGLLLTHFLAEGFWLTTVSLYSAPGFWLAPMLLLVPASLFWERRLLLLYPLLVVFLVFFHMRWNPFPGGDPTTAELIILSNNVGQRGKTSFRNYEQSIVPDIILLQEVGGRIYKHERDFPGYHAAASGEFGILSRHPILLAEPVPGLELPVAARFRVLFGKEEVILYNVHLPTPRRNLQRLRGNGFLHSLASGGGLFSKNVRGEFNEFMDRNLRLAEKIVEAASGEDSPVVIAGDFNAPAQGRVARTMAKAFQDVHLKAGGGCGFTFPGVSRNPFSLFGPFLRIDHAYANGRLRPVGCRVEPRRPSQHLAVAAGFDLSDL